ncbi:MAG TPA: hypothetical protein VFI31_12930, partial [Pirellulales bacterium]|nr:hypothetical protein [Pirellulales bacterium]
GLFFDRGRPSEIGWVAGLGIDAQIAATTLEQKAAFLRECREEGRKVALVGDGPIDDELQRQAHVAIALANDDTWQSATAPLVLLQPRLSKVVALWNVAHARHCEVGVAHRYALIPNLFCVAGAFFFGFTSLAAVALTNVGTLATFHRINRRLRRLEPPPKAETVAVEPASAEQQTVDRIEHLPKEVGALLISVGVAGMMLPGLVGAPAVLAGGLVLWPGTFGKLEDWFQRRCPEVHRKGVRQMARYLDDLETRFPKCMQNLPPDSETQTCNA